MILSILFDIILNMKTITIPKKFMLNNDFVIIPRRQYENLLRSNVVVKRSTSFKVPKRHEKFYNDLDKELTVALREVKEGKVVGPFNKAEEGIRFLQSRKKFVINK